MADISSSRSDKVALRQLLVSEQLVDALRLGDPRSFCPTHMQHVRGERVSAKRLDYFFTSGSLNDSVMVCRVMATVRFADHNAVLLRLRPKSGQAGAVPSRAGLVWRLDGSTISDPLCAGRVNRVLESARPAELNPLQVWEHYKRMLAADLRNFQRQRASKKALAIRRRERHLRYLRGRVANAPPVRQQELLGAILKDERLLSKDWSLQQRLEEADGNARMRIFAERSNSYTSRLLKLPSAPCTIDSLRHPTTGQLVEEEERACGSDSEG